MICFLANLKILILMIFFRYPRNYSGSQGSPASSGSSDVPFKAKSEPFISQEMKKLSITPSPEPEVPKTKSKSVSEPKSSLGSSVTKEDTANLSHEQFRNALQLGKFHLLTLT